MARRIKITTYDYGSTGHDLNVSGCTPREYFDDLPGESDSAETLDDWYGDWLIQNEYWPADSADEDVAACLKQLGLDDRLPCYVSRSSDRTYVVVSDAPESWVHMREISKAWIGDDGEFWVDSWAEYCRLAIKEIED